MPLLAVFFLLGMTLVLTAPRAGEQVVPLKDAGLYLAGVGFFTAVPYQGADGRTMELRYGDVETLSWVPGTLPVLDAHVLVINASARKVPRILVRVSIYLGTASLASFPEEEAILPGGAGTVESLFFEREYVLKGLARGSMDRIAVTDIGISHIIEDQYRQNRWPAYLRVEAMLMEKPEGMAAPMPRTSNFLKIVPRDVAAKANAAGKPSS
jgi:hypothetical protein